MNKFLTFSTSTILLLAAFLIAGCSSSDDGVSTGTTAATITSENAEALATAGTEGVKQAVNSNNVSPFAKINNATATGDFTVALAQQISQGPSLLEQTIDICDSGSVVMDIDEDTGNGSITYNNCVIDGSTVNGSATFTSSTVGSITTTTITFVNFTITTGSETETIDLSAVCTINSDPVSVSCTFNSTALGIDGRTYTVSDVSVSGDSISGYTVSATITDPDHGIVTITTTTPVTFNCPNGQPGAGVIVVSDGTNTMTVTYNNCDSFTIDFDGSTTAFFW